MYNKISKTITMKKCTLLLLTIALTWVTVLPLQAQSWPGGGFRQIFESSPKFEKGAWMLQFGVGLKNDTKITEFESKVTLPAISFNLEKIIAKNIGVGLVGGIATWKANAYNYPYRQFNIGLRGSYHFNFLEKLDPYIAIGGTFRYMDVRADEYYGSEMKVSANILVGGRFYFSDKFAVMAEIGDDVLTWLKAGVCFKLK
jgi:hypothetical protein